MAKGHNLAKRELEIVAGIAYGLSNVEVADVLGITENTVRTMLWSIYSRFYEYIGDRNPRMMLLRYYWVHHGCITIEIVHPQKHLTPIQIAWYNKRNRSGGTDARQVHRRNR